MSNLHIQQEGKRLLIWLPWICELEKTDIPGWYMVRHLGEVEGPQEQLGKFQ